MGARIQILTAITAESFLKNLGQPFKKAMLSDNLITSVERSDAPTLLAMLRDHGYKAKYI